MKDKEIIVKTWKETTPLDIALKELDGYNHYIDYGNKLVGFVR